MNLRKEMHRIVKRAPDTKRWLKKYAPEAYRALKKLELPLVKTTTSDLKEQLREIIRPLLEPDFAKIFFTDDRRSLVEFCLCAIVRSMELARRGVLTDFFVEGTILYFPFSLKQKEFRRTEYTRTHEISFVLGQSPSGFFHERYRFYAVPGCSHEDARFTELQSKLDMIAASPTEEGEVKMFLTEIEEADLSVLRLERLLYHTQEQALGFSENGLASGSDIPLSFSSVDRVAPRIANDLTHILVERSPTQGVIEYDVALSFAGEDRYRALELAKFLQNDGYRVFVDAAKQADLWGKNLYPYLSKVFGESSRYCVVFVSKPYSEKVWTNLELQRAMERALRQKSEYILPIRVDDTKLEGIRESIVFLDIREKGIPDVFNLLKKNKSF